MVVGLVINRDGFPQAHEIFDGNTQDRASLPAMLDALEARVGGFRRGQMVVVDRGMAFEENLEQLRARGLRYLVASRHSERTRWLSEFETIEGFDEVIRIPSPRLQFNSDVILMPLRGAQYQGVKELRRRNSSEEKHWEGSGLCSPATLACRSQIRRAARSEAV